MPQERPWWRDRRQLPPGSADPANGMSPGEVWLVRLGLAAMLIAGVVIAIYSDSIAAPIMLAGFSIGWIWHLPAHQRRQVVGFGA